MRRCEKGKVLLEVSRMQDIRENLSFSITNKSYPYFDDVIDNSRSEYESSSVNYGNAGDEFDSYSGMVRRDSLYIVIPVTIIYVSILLTGTVGNISTCIVIARNKSMQTATNYYLFSLAVSDLLLLVLGLPAEIYMVWYKYPYIFGEAFCVVRGLAAETSTNATVLIITAFTIERYLAICHPFLSQTMSNLSRAIKLILILWVVAFSFALPQAMQVGVISLNHNPDMVMCTVKILLHHSFELSTFLFFVVPMCLITVLYALIGLKLRKSNLMKRNSTGTDTTKHCRHKSERSSRRVLKMLVAVVVAFFICWAPFHVQRLVAIYGMNSDNHIISDSKWMEFLNLVFTYVSGVLYYLSTTINPILYNIMSNKFRAAFMETLWKGCRVSRLRSRSERRSYSTLSRSQQLRVAPGEYSLQNLGTFDGDSTAQTFDTTNIIRQNSTDSVTTQLMYNSPGGPVLNRQNTILTDVVEAVTTSNVESRINGGVTNVNTSAKANLSASLKVNVSVDVKVNVTGCNEKESRKDESVLVSEGDGLTVRRQQFDNSPSLVRTPREPVASLKLQRECRALQTKKSNFGIRLVKPKSSEPPAKEGHQAVKWFPRLRIV